MAQAYPGNLSVCLSIMTPELLSLYGCGELLCQECYRGKLKEAVIDGTNGDIVAEDFALCGVCRELNN